MAAMPGSRLSVPQQASSQSRAAHDCNLLSGSSWSLGQPGHAALGLAAGSATWIEERTALAPKKGSLRGRRDSFSSSSRG